MFKRGIIKSSHRYLCVDETKVDGSFPDHQFKIPRYQLNVENSGKNSKGGENSFIVKQIKNFETENTETICL